MVLRRKSVPQRQWFSLIVVKGSFCNPYHRVCDVHKAVQGRAKGSSVFVAILVLVARLPEYPLELAASELRFGGMCWPGLIARVAGWTHLDVEAIRYRSSKSSPGRVNDLQFSLAVIERDYQLRRIAELS